MFELPDGARVIKLEDGNLVIAYSDVTIRFRFNSDFPLDREALYQALRQVQEITVEDEDEEQIQEKLDTIFNALARGEEPPQ